MKTLAVIVFGLVVMGLPNRAMFVHAAFAALLSQPTIVVGPNILVSSDAAVPHFEVIAAASAVHPANILAGSQTLTGPGGDIASRAYASTDGGNSWVSTAFPDVQLHGGGDPTVAFGTDGTAYFGVLTMFRTVELQLYRSYDGGISWTRPTNVGPLLDRPFLAVDRSAGPHHGRLYIVTLRGSWSLLLYYSDDNGKTFTGPIRYAHSSTVGYQNAGMSVLRDGTLVVTYQTFPTARKSVPKLWTDTLWVATSRDGGRTFSSPVQIGVERHWLPYESAYPPRIEHITANEATADETASPCGGTTYGVWSDDPHGGNWRIMTSSLSPDGHVREAHPIDVHQPTDSSQFEPMIAVNKDGVVGVAWLDTRGSEGHQSYREFFSMSTDCGQTFSPPVVVSSERSMAPKVAQPYLDYSLFSGRAWNLNLGRSEFVGRGQGDYVGLTATADGTFHPVWPDMRTGVMQLFTAAVRIGAQSSVRPRVVQALLNTKVEPVIEPFRFQTRTMASIVVRLRNTSNERLYGPFKLVAVFAEPRRSPGKVPSHPSLFLTPKGATRNATAVLGSFNLGEGPNVLPPGAVTNAVTFRVRLDDTASSNMKIDIYGFEPL